MYKPTIILPKVSQKHIIQNSAKLLNFLIHHTVICIRFENHRLKINDKQTNKIFVLFFSLNRKNDCRKNIERKTIR